MQPPPRKGKPSTLLKNTHNEQLVKLQMKHTQDSDFLDDIRNFTKMRAIIEKDYAQALLKLATSHLQKKAPVVPDGETYKTVYSVWKTMLDETEKIAKARLAAAEVYQQQVSEQSKSLRLYKLQVAKKCFENLKKMHEEIQTCVTEIEKTKKLYFEEEHMAHEAREKAHDADEKLKRKKGRIFQSISSLQKNSAKFSFRREACDIQATKARNDYVLALLAANAHQSKFYESDLPELVQYIDCDIYEKVKEYILLIARTELLTCAACQSSFSTIQDQANMASGQYTMECFFRDNAVLSQPILYDFEPCDNDKINTLCIEHNAALCLSREAKRWASCVAKEIRVTRDSKEELRKLLAQIGDKPPYALQSDQIGPQAELEARIDELRQIIRRSQTSKKKAESRLEAMREAGVNVDEWLKILEQESVIEQETVMARESPKEIFSRSGTVTSRASQKSNISEPVFEGSDEVNDAAFEDSDTAPEPTSAPADSVSEASYMPDYTSAVDVVAAMQDAWDAAAETEEAEEEVNEEPANYPPPESQEVVVNGEVPTAATGQRCVALFSYEACNSDELSFVEQEELELINEGDGDGWVMARNYKGEEGYIPQNYVEVVEAPSAETSSRPPLTSFSSVDYTMPNEDKDAGLNVEEPVPTVDTAAVTNAEPPQSEVERPADLPAAPAPTPAAPIERIMCCQAVYDYEATCDEELTFFEGQIIRILRKNVCDVDDGWWEGEIDGKIGLFPSLVVEELKENGEPLTPMTPASPPGSCPPPAFTPPEEPPELVVPATQIILTQPTPEIEQPTNAEQKAPEDDDGKYTPLVSSPDSPTKAATDGKSKDNDDGAEIINTEIKAPSPGIEDCPTVVVTSITAGDTPTSDDDMEVKVKEEEPPKENDAGESTYRSADEFECTFPDIEPDVSNQQVPSSSETVVEFGQKKATEEPPSTFAETEKMEVNGVDATKNFFSDSQNAETTG